LDSLERSFSITSPQVGNVVVCNCASLSFALGLVDCFHQLL
jgi:hypothetical protein